MANNKIQVKRTSTSGRTPNTTNSGNAQYIDAGELAINMTDGILYSSNGSALLPIGANNVNVNVSNNLNVGSNLTVQNTVTIQTDNDALVVGNSTTNTVLSYDLYGQFLQQTSRASNGSGGNANSTANYITILATYDDSTSIETKFQNTAAAGDKGIRTGLSTDNSTSQVYQIVYNQAADGGGNTDPNVYFTAQIVSISNYASKNVSTTHSYSNSSTGTEVRVTETDISIGSNNSSNTYGYTFVANASTLKIGAINSTSNGSVLNATTLTIGNSSVNATVNSTTFTGTALTANNATNLGGTAAASYVQNTDSRTLSGNLVISGTYFNPSANTILLGNSTQRWVISGNSGDFSSTVNAVTSVNSALLTVGTSFIANTTGAYHTGTVNAASHTVGTTAVTNSTARYFGTINATSNGSVLNATTLTIGNSSVNATVNSTTFTGTALTANASTYLNGKTEANLNVNNALTANSATYLGSKQEAGLNVNSALTSNNASYLGGTAAASYVQNTDSRTLSGNLNFTGSNVQFATHYLGNDQQLRFRTVNTSAYVYFVQQSDDNFVFYTTNATYGARPILSIYANSDTSSLSLGAPVAFTGSNVSFSTGTSLYANGSAGAAGQVLTSNGSSVYWTAVSGSGSTNVNAQYVWSNLHTFQANVAFTGNNISLVSNTGSIFFGGGSDANWRIGRSTGAITKIFYTNNSLDIIAADSNLEGVVIGKPSGNSYLETGYNGTYTKNPIYIGTINSTSSGLAANTTVINIGNSSVNSTINSTAFTGAANNASYLGGTAAASFVQNTDSRTLSGNLVISGTYFNPSANTILLGNSTQRWVISGNSGDFSSTVNAVTSVNSALLTVGTSFIANTTGAYHTGTVNAASITTTGVTVNTIGVYPASNTSGQNLGTATQRFDTFLDTVDVSGTINSNAGANAILLANQTTKWIYFTAGGAAAPTTTTRSDGTKIVIWPSLGASAVDYAIGADNNVLWYSVGQSTASHIWYANTTTVLTANLGGVYTSGTVNAASHTVGTTAVTNSTAIYFGTINSTSNGSVLNATSLTIGNSTVNTTVNSTAFNGTANNASYLGGTLAASYVQNTDSRTLSGNLVISGTYFNPSANTILLGNSTQRWVISGNSGDFSATVNAVTSVNSALLTVGTSFIANTTGAYHTGTVNAASHTVGSSTIANSTGVYTGVVNGSSHTVGSSFIANSTAIVGTGYANVTTSVNSALLTVGTSFIANTTGAYHTGVINAASHTTTGVTINATAVALATSAGIYANSTLGTAGQALLSNGTTAYWGAAGGGYYYGSNGTIGDSNNKNNIFRVNANTLYANVTFAAGENGTAAGPIAINSGVFLTISTGARVAIV